VAGFCRHDNEFSGTMEQEKFIEYLNNSVFFMEDFSWT
jgi:hypothetical protein